MKDKTNSLGARRWCAILLIGLFGQIAWAIENNYINLWVYSQSHNADHITWMTMASSIVAALTTFFMGALSDKLGKRKIFIALGYSIWGVMVFLFGVMSLSNMQAISGGDAARAVLLVGIMNVVVDCLMTFFGSTSNDAAFNAYVTDETSPKNRPFVESILSVMPLISLAIMLGVGMILGIPGTQGDTPNSEWANQVSQSWFIFFLIFGILTALVGVASFFLLPADHIEPTRDTSYFKHMVKGFFPKTVKANPLFYITLLAFMLFNIAIDSFLPFIMVYIQNLPCMGNNGMDFIISLGLIFGISAAIVIVIGIFLDRIGKRKVIYPAIALLVGGALGYFFVQESFTAVILCGIPLIAGYLIGTTALGAEIRDRTPENDVGAFQSVRMVFVVTIPMVVGSNLSSAVFQTEPVVDPSTGAIEKAPDKWMFIVTAVAGILSIAPTIWLSIAAARENKIQSVVSE